MIDTKVVWKLKKFMIAMVMLTALALICTGLTGMMRWLGGSLGAIFFLVVYLKHCRKTATEVDEREIYIAHIVYTFAFMVTQIAIIAAGIRQQLHYGSISTTIIVLIGITLVIPAVFQLLMHWNIVQDSLHLDK